LHVSTPQINHKEEVQHYNFDKPPTIQRKGPTQPLVAIFSNKKVFFQRSFLIPNPPPRRILLFTFYFLLK